MTNFASRPTKLTEALADFEAATSRLNILITEQEADFQASKAREQILRERLREVAKWGEKYRYNIDSRYATIALNDILDRSLFIDEGAAS